MSFRSVPLLAASVALAALTLISIPSSTATAAAPPVRFSRVQYDSPGADTGTNSSLNAEWARVTNFSSRARVLTGWTIRDRQAHVYKFPTFTLKAGASVRLHTGRGKNTTTDVYWRQDWYVWNNGGDKAILRNRSGVVIDACTWGDGIGYINC